MLVVDKAVVLRRALHMSYALCLLYYVVPDPLPILGVSKPAAAIAGVALVAALEVWRIRRRSEFFLLRDYEQKWFASYFWLGAGCVMALVLFPPALAAPAILGTTLVDPAMGEVRLRLGPDTAIFAGFLAWGFLAQGASILSGLALAPPLLAAGAAAAALAEGRRIPRLDDDFLMTLSPLVVMSLLQAALALG